MAKIYWSLKICILVRHECCTCTIRNSEYRHHHHHYCWVGIFIVRSFLISGLICSYGVWFAEFWLQVHNMCACDCCMDVVSRSICNFCCSNFYESRIAYRVQRTLPSMWVIIIKHCSSVHHNVRQLFYYLLIVYIMRQCLPTIFYGLTWHIISTHAERTYTYTSFFNGGDSMWINKLNIKCIVIVFGVVKLE